MRQTQKPKSTVVGFEVVDAQGQEAQTLSAPIELDLDALTKVSGGTTVAGPHGGWSDCATVDGPHGGW